MASEDILHVNEYVFGLDIGTRSIVGIVGYKEGDQFVIIGHHTALHDTRAMIDGQIHNIEKVADTVNTVKTELEKQIGFKLQNVCIAAAGRVLKTYDVHVEEQVGSNEIINKDHVHLLELMAIEKAHELLNKDLSSDDTTFHCVGYSVIRYYLNDYALSNLEGHKGKKIGVDLLGTFLPQEVVDSLHTVINKCDLNISNLTLEPIAAINVAIPEHYRLLNIALVDIGAGTSDIAITKEGSIIAYGMIPMAGDEITEQIVHHYLVDFGTAEKIKLEFNQAKSVSFKDIMGIPHIIDSEEIFNKIKPTMDILAENIGDKIMELNGGKSTNAVFLVGGGGRLKEFTDVLADKLTLVKERVALRGSEVLDQIIFKDDSLKNPEMVTPVGICLSGLNKDKSDFIRLTVNGEAIKIFNNNNLTLVDVVAYKGFNHKNLICRRGKDLNYVLNGEKKKLRGDTGEPAIILINGEVVGLNHPIGANDDIILKVAKHGKNPLLLVENLLAEFEPFIVYINNNRFTLPYRIVINNEVKDSYYKINDKDEVIIDAKYTIANILELSEINEEDRSVYINDEIKSHDYIVKPNDRLIIEVIHNRYKEIGSTMDSNDADIEIATTQVDSIIHKNDTCQKVYVNGSEILLRGKKSYIFVDVFDYIDFDLKKPQGKIICLVNGKNTSYMEKINFGDKIEVYWDK